MVCTERGLGCCERYVKAVEVTCELIGKHPLLGPLAGLAHPRLCKWRFIVVFRPFQKHILFYEMNESGVALRRVMHGHRNLPERLLEPPQ